MLRGSRQLSIGRDAEYGAALAFALTGDVLQSQELADDLANRFPEDTLVKFAYLPVLRAAVALSSRDASKAIKLLQLATTYEFGFQGANSVGFTGSLYPAYVRGQAFLMASRGVEAAAEFHKIIDHRGVVLAEPIGALSNLQLGRAFASAGDGAKARTAYKDFLALWRDADADIPILRQAKSEYARLE